MATAQDFRIAVEAQDIDGMLNVFTEDARLHSPVSFKPFEGKAAIRVLFGVLFEVFENFRYTDELSGEGTHALIFRTTVGDREVEGLDLMRINEDGMIDDFTVMVRPRSGVEALMREVGSRLGHLG